MKTAFDRVALAATGPIIVVFALMVSARCCSGEQARLSGLVLVTAEVGVGDSLPVGVDHGKACSNSRTDQGAGKWRLTSALPHSRHRRTIWFWARADLSGEIDDENDTKRF
jgi:hypothetical protein